MRKVSIVAAVISVLALAGCERSMRFGQQTEGAPKAFVKATLNQEAPFYEATPLTIEVWVKAPPATCCLSEFPADGPSLVRSESITGYYGFIPLTVQNRAVFGITPDGDLFYGAQRESIPLADRDTSVPSKVRARLPGVGVRDGKWHHVAVQRTLDGGVTIWFDGSPMGSGTSGAGALDLRPPGPWAQNNNLLTVGGQSLPMYDATAPFDGILDELRISNVARYSGTFTPPTSKFQADQATLGLWHFDGLDGGKVADSSGRARNLMPLEAGPGGTGDGFAGDSPFIK